MPIRTGKLVYPGRCLSHDANGRPIFVEGALPGELVELEAWRRRKGVVEARAGTILEPAAERIAPRCPSFGTCGGCTFQHAGYADQLRFKLDYAQEALSRIGVRLETIIPSPTEWSYRNKMELSFAGSGEQVILGLHRKGRFDAYVRVPPCLIADAAMLPVIEQVEAFARASGRSAFDPSSGQGFWRHAVIRRALRSDQLMVILVTTQLRDQDQQAFWQPLLHTLTGASTVYWATNERASDAVIPESVQLLRGAATIEEQLVVGGRSFAFSLSPFSFFQTNTAGAERLYETVLEYAAPTADDDLLDLFCGTGSIGICLAPRARSVHGVETVPEAVEQARENARTNGIATATFEARSTEDWIRDQSPGRYGIVIVDPPRGGLHPRVPPFLSACGAHTIVYVSCNPVTLARDLPLITGAGRYRVERAVAVDMFPQTSHVECVVRLTRS